MALVIVAVTRLVASSTAGQTRLVLLNVITLMVPLTAALVVVRRARSAQGRTRSHLLWLAAGLGSWAAGQAYWFVAEIALQHTNPFPSWADVGYLGLFPALGIALVLAPSDRLHELSRRRRSVDALGVGSSVLLLMWASVLFPALEQMEHSGVFATSVGLAYPSGDVLLLGLLVTMVLVAKARWRPALLRYATGVGLLLLADAGFASLSAAGTYGTGSWFDAGWSVGFALLARGALRAPLGSEEPVGRVADRNRGSDLVVLVAFLVAGGVGALKTFDGGLEKHPILAGLMSLVFLALLVRASTAQAEGEAYSRQLAKTQENLVSIEREHQIALAAAGMVPIPWSAATQRWALGEGTRELLGLEGGGDAATTAELMRALNKEGRAALRALTRSVSSEAPGYDLELPLRSRPTRHVRLRGEAVCSAQGEVVNFRGVIFDTTESRRAREAQNRRVMYAATLATLAARLARRERLDEALEDTVATLGDVLEVPGVEVWVAGQRLVCWRSPALDAADDQARAEGLTGVREFDIAVRGEPWGRLVLRFSDDHETDPDLAAYLAGVVTLLGTCVERTRAREALWHGARYDALTGLANRTLLSEHLKMRLATTTGLLAVVYLDVDDFKQVNARFGHPVGDLLLQAIAERLSDSVRPGDFVARLGGDEFAIVMGDLPQVETAMEVSGRVQQAVSQPLHLESNVFKPRTSLGVATTAESGTDAVTLLRNADLAMYVAKRLRQHGSVLFQQPFLDEAVAEGELADEVRGAVDRGELVLHYQPVVRLETGRVEGAEALLRWMRPGHGLQPPFVFLPLAQRLGLMPEVTRFVLREACRWAAAHLEGRTSDVFVVAVNVAGEDVADPRFPDLVRTALADAGLAADHLCLEILESSVLSDVPAAAARLSELRGYGVHVALDDFGTGFSTMSQLKTLPVDLVKIDKAFVDGLGTHLDDSALVSSLIGMAHALGLDVVAEGVETERQLEVLVAMGCEMGQGYLFGRPTGGPPAEVVRLGGHAGMPTPPAAREPTPRPRTVVIADDLADDRRILVRFLTRSGLFTVVGEAGDGAEAARLVQDLHPDVALLDISMPVLDGLSCLARIRDESPATAVVMLSGYTSDAAVRTALEAGAVGCLPKGPVDPSHELAALLETAEVSHARPDRRSRR